MGFFGIFPDIVIGHQATGIFVGRLGLFDIHDGTIVIHAEEFP